jgi:hypothetical protein
LLDGGGDRLAGEQIITKIDRPKMRDCGTVPASQRLAALRSQSCFSVPSCGAINSGGKGSTCVCPGATTLAPRKAWKHSTPPSERRRVEHCGHLILREQKYSLPSSAINTRSPRRWNRVSGPAASMARMNRPSKAAGETPSSIKRI